MRWLAVDYGHKRVGLATGYEADGFATPVKMIPGGHDDRVIREILVAVKQFACGGIVVGWPINMDNSEGPQAIKTREFAAELARQAVEHHIRLDVRMWDERLSSFHADGVLAGTLTRGKRKARQDAIAAAAILNAFFDDDGPQKAQKP
ncbi:MAG: Holliday junction resolvase RuvX [Phycisphaerales bacterium]|jgi:putative holliday junction resolvase|nr:Holliday junction resolvase RuvX [Phycisphaerales bacterium]MBT7171153.1 Holliday junction resolvase RuvX [Phycisphaerales bacterium]